MAKNIDLEYCCCFEPGDGACMRQQVLQEIIDHPRHVRVLNDLNIQTPTGKMVDPDYLVKLIELSAPHARISQREGVPPLCEFKDRSRGNPTKVATAQHSNGCTTDAALISVLKERLGL